jgi:transcription termination factor Rho
VLAGGAAKPQGSPLEGILEVQENRQAFLRDPKRNYAARATDPQIPAEWLRKYDLRGGELLAGPSDVVQGRAGRVARLLGLDSINGIPLSSWQPPTPLGETTAVDPAESLHFDTPGGPVSMRIIDLFTPIGRGQRGLIVAPPRTGKTMLLQQMAHGIAVNHPEVYMLVLLIDERPEEVTEMRRNVRGEVVASSNDLDATSHVRIARLIIERARRMVESGQHIVILLDSITRLARAFNTFIGSSGRTMTGGLDIRALQEPKQMFGAARNVENGGSLTILATALIDTGSRADDFIFQEFKGTGNMELVLSRELANLRIWPAVDLQQSGTRKEEKLLKPDVLAKANMLRRQLHDMPPARQVQTLVEKMSPHKDLASYLATLRMP